MKKLTGAQRKWLRGQAHPLKPIVRIGKQGWTGGVLAEVEAALDVHELIKVHFTAPREEKEEMARTIGEATGADPVGLIGHVITLYRQNPDSEKRVIELPVVREAKARRSPATPAGRPPR
jgi:RNA-binding protein